MLHLGLGQEIFMYAGAVVVHTVDDQALAEELAADMANHAWRERAAFWKSERVAPDEAVRRAYAAERAW